MLTSKTLFHELINSYEYGNKHTRVKINNNDHEKLNEVVSDHYIIDLSILEYSYLFLTMAWIEGHVETLF